MRCELIFRMNRSRILLLALALCFTAASSSFATMDADVLMAYSPDSAARAGGEPNIQVWLSDAIGGGQAPDANNGPRGPLRVRGVFNFHAQPRPGFLHTRVGQPAGGGGVP